MTSTIQNEVELQKVQVGTETVLGTAVTPTFKLGGNLVINRDRPLSAVATRDGTFAVASSVKFGTTSFDGQYDDQLSYEDYAIMMRYAVSTPPTATSDGQSTPGFTRPYRPGQGLPNSASIEYGVDGLLHKATGVQFNEYTIGWDVDDTNGNWTISGPLFVKSAALGTLTSATTNASGTSTTVTVTAAGWTIDQFAGQYVAMRTGVASNIGEIRRILSNSATVLTLESALPAATASGDSFEIMAAFTTLSNRTVDYIATEGTQLFIANDVAGLATASNEVKDKMIKGSVTMMNNYKNKKFTDNIGTYSAKRGRSKRVGNGVITMEFDDWKEKKIWELALPTPRAIKVQQLNGPVINVSPETRKTAKITIPKIYWDDINTADRDGNLTADYSFGIYLDTVAGYDIEFESKTALAALP
jgi:hypothetical protein